MVRALYKTPLTLAVVREVQHAALVDLVHAARHLRGAAAAGKLRAGSRPREGGRRGELREYPAHNGVLYNARTIKWCFYIMAHHYVLK